ncbi:MAG: PIG-L family deacetylase, partial [Chitinophagaceae bacterium]
MKLHILAFGAHPDDIELACSGTLMIEKDRNKKIGLIDFTEGELGSRGNAEIRHKEALNASTIIGAEIRENLKLEDGFFEHNSSNLFKIIERIRLYQP